MLTPEMALEKRDFMLREGYVLIEDILPEALLDESARGNRTAHRRITSKRPSCAFRVSIST